MPITEESLNAQIQDAIDLCRESLEAPDDKGRTIKLIQAQEAIGHVLSYTPTICRVCGVEFYAKRNDAKVCGAACRMRLMRARKS